MKKQKYLKEIKEIVEKERKILNGQITTRFCRLAEQIWQLNKKYFEMRDLHTFEKSHVEEMTDKLKERIEIEKLKGNINTNLKIPNEIKKDIRKRVDEETKLLFNAINKIKETEK